MVSGITPPELGSGEDLVRQVVQPAGLPGALEDPRFLRAGVYRAGDAQELLPRYALYLAPQLVGVAQEQHVGGVLVVGETNDARVAMGGAHGVRDAEPLQTQHPFPPSGEVVGGGAPHRAHAHDDGVVAAGVRFVHRWVSLFGECLAGTFARASTDGTGWGAGSKRRSSSWGSERTRAFSGSKKGVGATLAGMGRPLISTIRLLPGQEW